METQLPPNKGAQPPIFGPCLLWPNGWMDEDAIWYGGKPRPRRRCVTCVRWGRSCPTKRAQPPVLGSCLLWSNGWMDEDATLYGSRPRPMSHCVRLAPPRKGHSSPPPLFGPCLLWPRSPISATAELLYIICITLHFRQSVSDHQMCSAALFSLSKLYRTLLESSD